MLNLSINNDEIVIDGNFSSLNYYLLPPKHLGFKKTEKSYNAPLSKNNLFDIILFYKDENIDLNLSEEVTNLFNNFQLSNQEFEDLYIRASSYKDGSIDKQHYSQFIDFIENHLSKDRTLREHQQKAAYHLYLIKNGANFSVPGSGKTSVVLAAYKKMLADGMVNHLFIAGPASCAKPWEDEYIATLGVKPNYIKLSGLNQTIRKIHYYGEHNSEKLFFATYNTLYNDKEHIKNLFKSLNGKVLFVLDEAHYIKRLGGEWANCVLELAHYANVRNLLTGTPIPKDFSDIFNMIDFLWLDQSPLDTDTKNLIEVSEPNIASEILSKKVGPLYYRVRKADLGLTPQKFHDTIFIRQNSTERKIYEIVLNNIRLFSYNDNKYKNDIDLLYRLWRARLIRLRQALSYPKLIKSTISNYKEDVVQNTEIEELIINYDKYETPAKIEYIITLVKKLYDNGEKVLIWSNFIDIIQLIKTKIKEQNIHAEKIIGNVPSEREGLDSNVLTREKIISNFLNGDIDVLVANPAACAESISLHKNCYHAIYYDLSYNLAQYIQSLDRIHRVGGSENKIANYYFLQYENTVEYKIKANLDKKKQKMEAIIDQDFAIYNLFMDEEDDIIDINEIIK